MLPFLAAIPAAFAAAFAADQLVEGAVVRPLEQRAQTRLQSSSAKSFARAARKATDRMQDLTELLRILKWMREESGDPTVPYEDMPVSRMTLLDGQEYWVSHAEWRFLEKLPQTFDRHGRHHFNYDQEVVIDVMALVFYMQERRQAAAEAAGATP